MADSDLWPYVLLIVFGFLPSVFWKLLSAFFAHGVDEDSPILAFVRAMATALLTGVACKLVLTPAGALALAPAALRYGALGAGMLAFAASRRSIFAAVLVAEATLGMGMWLWQ